MISIVCRLTPIFGFRTITSVLQIDSGGCLGPACRELCPTIRPDCRGPPTFSGLRPFPRAASQYRVNDAAGRYATDPRELAGDFLPAIPAPDPTVAAGTYGFGAQHQVVLDLKADAYPVCRLLNRSTGFSYAAVPDGKPANSRDGCWKAGDGYRFEYLP